jgi:hypothetical protein
LLIANSFADVIETVTKAVESVLTTEESQPDSQISPSPQESGLPVDNPESATATELPKSTTTIATTSIPVKEIEVIPVIETPTVDAGARFTLLTPASLTVDPRAQSYLLPHFQLRGSAPVLVCFKGNGTKFDINQLNSSDASSFGNVLIEGERTSFLAVAGSVSDVSTFLRVSPIWLYSSKGLRGSYFTVSATGLTDPYLDVAACESFAIKKYISLRPLELQIGITKGEGRLK